MSYEKAMKHAKNPHKIRYYQQCGFSFKEQTFSGAEVASRTAESYYVGKIRSKERLSPFFEDSDDAVDFFRALELSEQLECGIFTDKGILLMQ